MTSTQKQEVTPEPDDPRWFLERIVPGIKIDHSGATGQNEPGICHITTPAMWDDD